MYDKLLITGATGFIGNWLMCHAWRHELYTRPVGHQEYDLKIWMKENWKYIIHLAPAPVDDVLECAERCGATVLLASSGGVYDREPDPYFQMKLEDENKLLGSGLDVKIARIFTTCGGHMQWKRYAIG